jgi:hypothetical protein
MMENKPKTIQERIIAAIQKILEADKTPDHPGLLISYDDGGIDDGNLYGEVKAGREVPDFVAADDENWVTLPNPYDRR